METVPAPTKPNHTIVLGVCFIIIMLGLVLFYNYLMKLKIDNLKMQERPPYASTLKHNLELTKDDGSTVNIGQLEGKVWIVAYVYTRCPRACAGIAQKIKVFADKYAGNPNFRAVAITLYPEEDTPEFLKAWREQHGLLGDQWWFLTGNGEQIRGYMQKEFKLPLREIPENERLNAFDRWDHKAAIVLVDHKRRIRRTADFGDASVIDIWEKQLDRDIAEVLKEAAEEP
jgi:protein SCO1/2